MCKIQTIGTEQALAYLIINGSYLNDLGLFHGKMGIVLFFSELAHVNHNPIYEDLASSLLGEIYEEIHYDLPINLENGLCGIGWGIEYLVQHGLMEGDTDEILSDIDQKVMEINPFRIKDFSIRRGLGGIVYYVLARLNASRQSETLPFDKDYLKGLQEAILQAKFPNENEMTLNLSESLQQVLSGRHIDLQLPTFLTTCEVKEASFDEVLLGLEGGLTGWLWNQCITIKTFTGILPLLLKEKCIFLFELESRSMNYGIGTYLNQLTEVLHSTEWQVVRIRLFSERTDSFLFNEEEKTIYLDLANFKSRGCPQSSQRYYRNIFYLLYAYFQCAENLIFHLNSMQGEILVGLLKEYFPQSSVVLTMHYTDWSFKLLGDKKRLYSMLKNPEDDMQKKIVESFFAEKQLMETVDRIIAIALHSYNDILQLYQIPEKKVCLIPHGLADEYRSMCEKERMELRKKYGFLPDDQLLIFAGRIDMVKGSHFLCEAFTRLSEKYPNLRLIIAGDGNLEYLLSVQKPIWSKITCTGYVDKEILYELYAISDIGVLPSLHEEFGLVALEMMMMKLPLIVGKTTGLSELVIHEETGLHVFAQENDKNKSVSAIQSAITELLNDMDKRIRLGEQGRKHYLQQYAIENFSQNMKDLYQMNLLIKKNDV